MTHVIFFFTSQKIRFINPEMNKTQVHKYTPDHGEGGDALHVH